MKIHMVKKIKFEKDSMTLNVDGKEYTVKLTRISKKLANATAEEKEKFIISPSGYGIHWPALDEDLAIDAIIGIKHNTPVFRQEKMAM